MHHVTEADLRAAVREVTGRSYDWFFEQWIHTTATLDYGLGEISVEPKAGGTWSTQVEVIRRGEAWMPVTLQVGSEIRKLDSRDRVQRVTITSAVRPAEVVLDPNRALIDAARDNNRRVLAH
jgi:hypothetical protein